MQPSSASQFIPVFDAGIVHFLAFMVPATEGAIVEKRIQCCRRIPLQRLRHGGHRSVSGDAGDGRMRQDGSIQVAGNYRRCRNSSDTNNMARIKVAAIIDRFNGEV